MKRVSLEKVYLAQVVMYIPSTIAFQRFQKINEKCRDAVKFLHVNPPNICAYHPFLKNNFPHLNTLCLDALSVQQTVSSEDLEEISWIDSSRQECEIGVLNQNVSDKVNSLRISQRNIVNLTKFRNLRQLIVQNIDKLNDCELMILENRFKLRTLILYCKNCSNASNVKRMARRVDFDITYVYFEGKCQAMEMKNLRFCSWKKMIREMSEVPGYHSTRITEPIEEKEIEEPMIFEMKFTENIFTESLQMQMQSNRQYDQLRTIVIECETIDFRIISFNEIKTLCTLSISVSGKSKFRVDVNKRLKNLLVNCPLSTITFKNIEHVHFYDIALECTIHNDFLDIYATKSISLTPRFCSTEFHLKTIDSKVPISINCLSYRSVHFDIMESFWGWMMYFDDKTQSYTLTQSNQFTITNSKYQISVEIDIDNWKANNVKLKAQITRLSPFSMLRRLELSFNELNLICKNNDEQTRENNKILEKFAAAVKRYEKGCLFPCVIFRKTPFILQNLKAFLKIIGYHLMSNELEWNMNEIENVAFVIKNPVIIDDKYDTIYNEFHNKLTVKQNEIALLVSSKYYYWWWVSPGRLFWWKHQQASNIKSSVPQKICRNKCPKYLQKYELFDSFDEEEDDWYGWYEEEDDDIPIDEQYLYSREL